MKDAFAASFFHDGVLGGAIYLKPDKVIYKTNKVTVDEKYRDLEMLYQDIVKIRTGRSLLFPTVTIVLKEGVSYKFIVFEKKKFLDRMDELKR
ncbi:MAG TPA: hypothetical protein IAC31_00520 [Candidatus Faecousia intestinigallinarum]|nr:hypothetical protein [Candidatus Faecousia intestinigallinarum]